MTVIRDISYFLIKNLTKKCNKNLRELLNSRSPNKGY